MNNFSMDKDHTIEVERLQDEFIRFPSILYNYAQMKSDAELEFEYAKASLSETESQEYVKLKASGEKITENHVKSVITTNFEVIASRNRMLEAKRNLETLKNYVEALRAKKDMLIQLGADFRKE